MAGSSSDSDSDRISYPSTEDDTSAPIDEQEIPELRAPPDPEEDGSEGQFVEIGDWVRVTDHGETYSTVNGTHKAAHATWPGPREWNFFGGEKIVNNDQQTRFFEEEDAPLYGWGTWSSQNGMEGRVKHMWCPRKGAARHEPDTRPAEYRSWNESHVLLLEIEAEDHPNGCVYLPITSSLTSTGVAIVAKGGVMTKSARKT